MHPSSRPSTPARPRDVRDAEPPPPSPPAPAFGSRAAEEAETWLEHLEASWAAAERLDTDDPRETGTHDASWGAGPEVNADADLAEVAAHLACVDRLAAAETFFGARRAYKGARSSWRHSGELLDRALARCEAAFARLLKAHAAATDTTNGANTEGPEDAHPASSASLRVCSWTAGIIPPPPPPLKLPIDRSTGVTGVEAAGSPFTPLRLGLSSPNARAMTPPTSTSASAAASARKRAAEEMHRHLFDTIPPSLRAVARALVTAPITPTRDTRPAALRMYARVRLEALEAALLDRSIEGAPPGGAATRGQSSAVHAGGTRDGGREAAEDFLEQAGRRWSSTLEMAVARWTVEERLAREVFGIPESDEEDSPEAEAASRAEIMEVVPEILEASAAAVLGWIGTLAGEPNRGIIPAGVSSNPGGGVGSSVAAAFSRAASMPRALAEGTGIARLPGANLLAGVGARPFGAGGRGGERDGDGGATADGNANEALRPEKLFALLRAHATLTGRLRWGLETSFSPRCKAAVAKGWREAVETAAAGARHVAADLAPAVASEAARAEVAGGGAGDDPGGVHPLVRRVVAFVTRLVTEHGAAHEVLFGGEDDGRGGVSPGGAVASNQSATTADWSPPPDSQPGASLFPGVSEARRSRTDRPSPVDSDGILAFTDDEDDEDAGRAVDDSATESDDEVRPSAAEDQSKSVIEVEEAVSRGRFSAFVAEGLGAALAGLEARVTPAAKRQASSSAAPIGAALAAVLCANNATHVVTAACDVEELRETLGDDWLTRHRALVERHVDAYVTAAWGKALTAMSPGGGAPDPKAGKFSEKQRQAVKDRFSVVNATVEEARRTQRRWVVPDASLRERLVARVEAEVVGAYGAFYERYVDSGFSRKNPHKYVVHTPAALADIVRGFFKG